MIKNNQFVIELAGIDVLYIQEATLPDVETNTLQYGNAAGRPDTKVAGKKKVSQLVLKKLRPSELSSEKYFRDWFESTSVLPPSAYKKNIVFREIDEAGNTRAVYACIGSYPQKITHSGFKRAEDNEFTMEEITMEMDEFIQLS